MTISITNTQLESIFFSNWETLDNISKPAIIVPNQRNMHILVIGSGSAGTMITHCIAVAAHLTEVVVVNSKELAIYQEETPTKEIILLYTAPQIDKVAFLNFKQKIKYDGILIISPVSLIYQKAWYHLLWKPPKGI